MRAHEHIEPNMTVNVADLKVGDFIRFRMSKYEPVVYLEITSIKLRPSGKTLGISGAKFYDAISLLETRQIFRPPAA